MAFPIMMQCPTVFQRDADHRFLGCSSCLVDCFRHFARLAMAKAYAALTVANDDKCSKAKALTTLNRF